MEIKPILPEEFVSKLQTNVNTSDVDFQSYFKPYIDMAINYAIGPYFWYIPDNRLMKIIAVSDNIRQLTPFKQVEWIGKGPDFLAQNIHPDDSLFVLSATTIGAEFHESLSPEKRIDRYSRNDLQLKEKKKVHQQNRKTHQRQKNHVLRK